MKTVVALLFGTVICLLHQDSADAQMIIVQHPDECCLKIEDKNIPIKKVINVMETSPHCEGPGALIVTTVSKKICVDPNCFWVKKNWSSINKYLNK